MFALGGQFENGETMADNSTAEPAFWAPRIEIKSEKWQSSKKKKYTNMYSFSNSARHKAID